MNIELKRLSPDKLNVTEWRFMSNETTGGNIQLRLNLCMIGQRETRRHGFVYGKMWNRYDNRGNTMRKEEVPLPDDVRAEALNKFCETIRVVF